MQAPRVSPSAYRRITALATFALAFIIVTGGAVRITDSGLGCPDWPTCAEDRLVAPWEYHAMVEFVNRTVTGLVSVAVILAVLASLRRQPRRRDLTWLSLGLVGGVVAQIILGGLTVLFHLKPQFVMGHMLLSMVLLANAVILHHRAGQPDGEGGRRAPVRNNVPGEVVSMGKLVLVAAGLVVFLGTVVTGSGPHGGDPDVERLSFAVPDVARAHGASVVLFLSLTLVTLWRLRRAALPGPNATIGAPLAAMRAGEILLAVSVAQAAVGYIQYFTGVPELLVGIHIAGAAAVWATAVRFLATLAWGSDEERPADLAQRPEPAPASRQ
ncbi:MAG: COX15/CtaA family protein [Actinomycetota bacterium]|nr:COX15/CtaA family protein [Actinomycetota bacterium]